MDKHPMHYEIDCGVIPIPLRPDVTVKIGNLPLDLSPAEAEKIGRVVKALAQTD